ncbi:MAG: MBL fold metallo-hydrolase [Deltaproteobacteria bacterium RIFOXYD12_FULL_57_12]|nr:MAG: MBL fold metallo-hydrolase [Deltaproteobacteria bacterium RIFOXYD12_FULL_57_12]
MRFCVLGSGSKGNATLVASGSTTLLIDGGLSAIEIRRRLTAIGVDFEALTAILLTHEHTDHIRGVPVLSRQGRIPVFASPATFTAAGPGLDRLFAYQEFAAGTTFTIQDLQIHPFAVSHDAVDPVGFQITDGRLAMGYCTDTGLVSRLMHHRLSGCHGLVLESNHDPEMLRNGSYPPSLQQRIRGNKGHLANQDAADFLKDLLHDGLEHVVLAHLSEANNRPALAMAAAQQTLAAEPAAGGAVRISLGRQNRVGELVCLGRRIG